MKCGPYSAPGRVAVDLGSVTFRLIQDVDLFGVSEEHLGGKLKKEKQRQNGETDHHCADLSVARCYDCATLLSSDGSCEA